LKPFGTKRTRGTHIALKATIPKNKMTSNVEERRRIFTFDVSAIEDDTIAPDDEMRGMGTKTDLEHHRRPPTRKQLFDNKEDSREVTASPSDDEYRIPPPMDKVQSGCDITHSFSDHPDFEAWKRDMTETLLFGTVGTSTIKSPQNVIERTDWKTARLNKRRLEKKLLHQQLRSVKSDGSTTEANTTSESESSNDEDSSVGDSYSSSMLQDEMDTRKDRKASTNGMESRKSRSGHDIYTVIIRKEPGSAGKDPRHKGPFQSETSIPLSPRSTAFQRPTVSAVETPLSPKNQPNSSELAEIMVELQDLKTWAAGAPPNRLRQPTPPSSPTSPPPPTNRASMTALTVLPSEEPRPASLPLNIVIQQLKSTPASPASPEKNHKTNKDKGVPTFLTIHTTTKKIAIAIPIRMGMAMTRKKKKHVCFTEPLITDTIYRPKTPRKDVDALYFQEEELLDWENDEETTLRDRFEVVVTEVENPENGKDVDQAYTGRLSIGTPVISFHNSYSYSFQDSSDDGSSDNESYDSHDKEI